MLKKYIADVKTRTPHERRLAALRVASTITGILALGWMATLGVRLGTPSEKTAQDSKFEAQVAAALSALSPANWGATIKADNYLEVPNSNTR